jgi:hypothetical protein
MMQFIGTSRYIIIDDSLQLEYIKLMCQFDKHRVASYLTSSQQLLYNHPQWGDLILQYCETYEIPEAVSFLYERRGEVSRALDFVLQKVNHELSQLKSDLEKEAMQIDPTNQLYRHFAHIPNGFKSSDEEFDLLLSSTFQEETVNTNLDPFGLEYLPLLEDNPVEEIKQVQSVLNQLLDAIVMCKRNTARKTLDEKGVRTLWFGLLDRFAGPLQQLRQDYDENGMLTRSSSLRSDAKRDALVDQERDKQAQLLFFQEQRENAESKLQRADDEDRDEVREKVEKYAKLETATMRTLRKIQKQIQDYDQQKVQDRASSLDMPKLVNLWLQRIYLKCLKFVLFAMLDSVDIMFILDKVIQDISAHDASSIEFRGIIQDMLQKHKWDTLMSKQAYKFLLDDTQVLTYKWQNKNNRAQVSPVHMTCHICFRPLATKWSLHDSVRIFLPNCSHGFHLECLDRRLISHCPLCTARDLKTASKKKSKEIDDDPRSDTSFDKYYETESKLKIESRMDLLQSQISNVENSLALLNTKKPQQRAVSTSSLMWNKNAGLIPPSKIDGIVKLEHDNVVAMTVAPPEIPKQKVVDFRDFLSMNPEDLIDDEENDDDEATSSTLLRQTINVNDDYFGSGDDAPDIEEPVKPKGRSRAVSGIARPVKQAEGGMKPVNRGDVRGKRGMMRLQDLLEYED